MSYSELQPSIACQPFIKQFWAFKKSAETTNRQILFPDSHPEVLLNLGGQMQILSDDQTSILPHFFSLGIHKSKLDLIISGEICFFSARCYPWASLGFPELIAPVGGVRNLDMLLPEQTPSSLKDFANIIESFLERETAVIDNLVQVFYQQEGYVHVLDALDQFDVSRRTLERFFEKNVKLSAKKFLQMRRFEKAMILLYYFPTSPLAEIGLSLGYADQAHFQREFKRFSGMTPGQFIYSLQKVS